MENNTSQNQSNSSNTNKSSQHNQGSSMMSMLQPHDMSRTVESAMHVFQGRHEKLPDLMQDLGHIIVKATKRFTTTQLIVAAGALTVGAILVSRFSAADDEEYEYEEK